MLHPIVLGTAGHIDHGKTSLVRALTGIDTDRLPVEKARGITTELGFARLDLGERRIAVVDVPGHERFVKSMVAGATGLDLVCLVIAADEGVMPQTREHLDICQLLGVRRGLIVLTKRDLVDDEWLSLVTADIRAAVAGTFLADAPLIPVSVRTPPYQGIDELKAAIATAIDALPPRQATGVFRQPVDRVFTVKGFGTIVTGTVLGGEVAVGDELSVIPSGLTARVRGIEVHGGAVDKAIAGHRAALNLGGVAVEDLARGDLLAHPGKVAPSHILDVELTYLSTAPGPLPERSKVLVHHGTAQVLATLALVGVKTLAPGGKALAQLRIDQETPLGALPGDHFIVRGFVATSTHGSTVGGGSVIRVLAPKARKGEAHAAQVTQLASARLDQRIALDIKAAAAAGLTLDDLVRRLGIPAPEISEEVELLVATGEVMAAGSHALHAAAVVDLEAKILAKLGPEGIGREELRTQLPPALPARAYDVILAGLVARGRINADADRVTKAAAKPAPLSPLETQILAALEAAKLEPPRPKELAEKLKATEPAIEAALKKLITAKLVTRIKDLVMHAGAVAEIRTKLVAFLEAHGTIDAQQWKDLTGASRKFTIPLAEHFDAEKLTLRVGDVRRKR